VPGKWQKNLKKSLEKILNEQNYKITFGVKSN
jgi:hypothetical protein